MTASASTKPLKAATADAVGPSDLPIYFTVGELVFEGLTLGRVIQEWLNKRTFMEKPTVTGCLVSGRKVVVSLKWPVSKD